MYDINVYQYETKPFNCSGKYGILPLNEKGLHKYYLGKNTHTRYYLNKFNPIILHDEKEEDAKKTVTLEPIIKEYVNQYEILYNTFYDAFHEFTDAKADVHFGGRTNMLKQPEFSNIDKVKAVYDLIAISLELT